MRTAGPCGPSVDGTGRAQVYPRSVPPRARGVKRGAGHVSFEPSEGLLRRPGVRAVPVASAALSRAVRMPGCAQVKRQSRRLAVSRSLSGTGSQRRGSRGCSLSPQEQDHAALRWSSLASACSGADAGTAQSESQEPVPLRDRRCWRSATVVDDDRSTAAADRRMRADVTRQLWDPCRLNGPAVGRLGYNGGRIAG